MGPDPEGVIEVIMPQVNVNDTEVVLLGWHIEDSQQVLEGQNLCEVETSKSVGDMPSPATGVLRRLAKDGDTVDIGELIAYIGPSAEAIDSYISSQPKAAPAAKPDKATSAADKPAGATAGAVELARRYGLDLSRIPAKGKVRRKDVESYIAEHNLSEPTAKTEAAPAEALPSALAKTVTDQGDLSDHQWAITQHLKRTQSRLVVAHVMMDVSMEQALAWIEAKRQAGVMTGPIPILLQAASVAIQAHEKLASFRLGRRTYKYNSTDIAYTARSPDSRLFTPVVRNVDQHSLDELANECGRLNMAIFRGNIKPDELMGGCLTVSVLNDQPVHSHIGLQNAYQSALLTAGAIHDKVALVEGKPVAIPTVRLNLSYDHGLLDGWEAAAGLEAVKQAIESLKV